MIVAFRVMIVARLHQMEVLILFPFWLPVSIKLHTNYEVCKQCFILEFPSYFCCLGVVLIFFCVGKAFKARLGNGVLFPTQARQPYRGGCQHCAQLFVPAQGA